MRTAGGRKENLYHLLLMFFCKKLYLVPAVAFNKDETEQV
jgi:hypothetical protein